jgi:hypothetical protein
MHRNIEGLKRSARLRREEATQRAAIALRRMEASDREINFRTVASEARVSAAWLYNHQELRSQIMRLRKSQTWESPAESERVARRDLSTKSVIATLRLRIKKLEEKNRELTERLEHSYGVIAEIRQGVSSTTSR